MEISGGKWYTLEISTKNTGRRLPKISEFSGVYVIVSQKDGVKETLYIGESQNVMKRLKDHISYSFGYRFRNNVYEYMYIKVKKEKRRFCRLTEEARLILRLTPSYNIKGVLYG